MKSRAAVRIFSFAAGVGLLAVLVGSAAAKPSGVGPGNSPNAKQCQQGGWEALVTSMGASFTSEDACTSYAAQGGTLAPKLTNEQQFEAICVAGSGTFSVGTGEWQCVDIGGLSQSTIDALAAPCAAAGGTSFSGGPGDGITFVDCNLTG
jgi:hypothetical protein